MKVAPTTKSVLAELIRRSVIWWMRAKEEDSVWVWFVRLGGDIVNEVVKGGAGGVSFRSNQLCSS